jgi:threonine aldolase
MTVDLRSDTMTRPTPAMLRAMAEAEVGDDVWREDPTTKRLEAAVAERFGHEAALFVPSGTMGNQICLRLAARPGTECLANEDNHILWYESGAAPLLSGIQFHAVAGERGRLDPAAARARVRPAEYGVPTTALAVEQTHNRGGGAVQPLAELDELRDLADGAGLHLHCDGARIWNASVASGVPLERYGAVFHSLSVCFSKGLAAPVGSAVVGGRDLVERASAEALATGRPLAEALLDLRDRAMAGVRDDAGHVGAALGVELPHEQRIAREALRRRHVLDGVALPQAVRVAERRHAALRRDAGAGEDEEERLGVEQARHGSPLVSRRH